MKKTNKIKGVHILSRTDARSLHALGENSGLIHVEITMTGTPLDGLHLALRNTVGQMGSYILDTWPIEAEDAVTLTAQMLDARDDTADEYADPLRLSIDPEYVAFLVTGA